MLIVTHEMQFARAVADRVLFFDGGEIVEQDIPERFFEHPKPNAHRSSCILSSSTPSVSTKPNERFGTKGWKPSVAGAQRDQLKPVTTRDSSRVGLKPATARTRCSRVKPIARPKRNPLRIPSHPQSPNNGALFVFAIRPSQQIATPAPAESPVPTDVTGNRLTAPAHTETRPAPLDATDSRRTAPALKVHPLPPGSS